MENREDKNKEKVWHGEAIAPETERTLLDLRQKLILEGFYLGGGTGLALHFGHRRSIDLDFFSADLFNEDDLLRKVEQMKDVSLVEKHKYTLHAGILGTKVSFLGYEYPMLFPLESFSEVAVADARDNACMKISTIMSRGKKRDFIDLYVVSQRYGLEHLGELFKQKYAKTHYNFQSVLKSLAYFQDAEEDPMPDMLAPISWEEVKEFFRKAVPSLR